MTKALHATGPCVLIAASATGIATEIDLIPVGNFQLKDARATRFTLDDPDAVIAMSLDLAPGGMLPIDFDHGLDGQGSKDGRAAGWITGLRVDGGVIRASVEWTPEGEAALKGKTYRFISPVFTHTKAKGLVRRILRAGLTNNPAIHDLAQVASKKEDGMHADLSTLRTALGLDAEAEDDAVITAAAEAITKAEADPDPAKFVPIAIVDELRGKLTEIEGKVAASSVERVVTAAKAEGKLTPAMVDWATSYASKDMGGFKAWLAAQPVIASGEELLPGLAPKQPGTLTAEEKAVCAQMGLDEETFLATKKEA